VTLAFVVLSAVGCLAMIGLFPRYARREQQREDGGTGASLP
jgi:hypothetical protein